MAFKVYLNKTVIQVEDTTGPSEPQFFNPSSTRLYLQGGLFRLKDDIFNYTLLLKDYTNIVKEDDTVPTSLADAIDYLVGFVNSGISGGGTGIPTGYTSERRDTGQLDWEYFGHHEPGEASTGDHFIVRYKKVPDGTEWKQSASGSWDDRLTLSYG